jgi:hypothetical protein
MSVFLTYYLITFLYCVLMSVRKWNRDVRSGGLGISPGLDTIAILMMCWALAPVDIFLTWVRVYKEYLLEYKRRNGRVVECTGLENRHTERYLGFESLFLRTL